MCHDIDTYHNIFGNSFALASVVLDETERSEILLKREILKPSAS